MKLTIVSLSLFLSISPAAAQDKHFYVGSAACANCHKQQAQSWQKSDHGLAWTWPSDDTVIADFNDTRFEGGDISVEFSQDNSGYHASVTENDGETTDYDVHSVVGIRPLQQYLFETEPGRLQSFDVVWDDVRKRWYHLYPDQNLPPDDGLHWTGPYKNWNGRCAVCHATGFEKNYDANKGVYQSTQAEIGVGCEACHGPGSEHLDWASTRDEPVDQSGLDAYGLTMTMDANSEQWIQQCAGCHSRREAFYDGNPVPGTPYADAYRLSLLRPGLYFPDGQIKDEVYVYGSFLQSKMYAKGVSCMNCHDPHSADVIAKDNAVCTQCHSPAGNSEFPSLPLKEFDSPAHHFHADGSEGAKCRNCHMTTQTYMGIDARADHSFRIPRPDLWATTGAPDACTTCHDDKTPDWAAAKIVEWYPNSVNRGPHFGIAFAHAARDPIAAIPGLLAAATNEDTADIVRATALYLMQPAVDAELSIATAHLLKSNSALVRSSAVMLQRAAGPVSVFEILIDMLDDPGRLVRYDVVQALLTTPITHLSDVLATDLQNVMKNWQHSLSDRADFPETHLVLGGTALVMRDFTAAEEAFREAVRLDPQLIDAWTMLVRIRAALSGIAAGRDAVSLALEVNPNDPLLLGLQKQLSSDKGVSP